MEREDVERIVKEVIARLSRRAPSQIVSSAAWTFQGKLLTEGEVRSAAERGVREIALLPGTLVTPLAKDAIKELGISVVPYTSEPERSSRPSSNPGPIAIGADHAGFALKETIREALVKEGHTIRDFGTSSPEPVDYPDFALRVAQAVSSGACTMGIVVDGTGFASAVVANKLPGIRAAVCWDLLTVRLAREHMDANVLAIGGKLIGPTLALEMVKLWLETPFAGGRHARRVSKISDVEGRYLRELRR
ncbi:MAG TPA: ribose 5-phosphate isomerase B [Candidatus Latescibacteria bacterium]|nr:ribose 5-phosphate isomerase B [Candidatus Latescibacterota bacterium]